MNATSRCFYGPRDTGKSGLRLAKVLHRRERNEKLYYRHKLTASDSILEKILAICGQPLSRHLRVYDSRCDKSARGIDVCGSNVVRQRCELFGAMQWESSARSVARTREVESAIDQCQ